MITANHKEPRATRIRRIARPLSIALLTAIVLILPIHVAGQKGDSPPPPKGKDECVTCHKDLPGEYSAPVTGMKHDVHAKVGLSCVDCHGGDASASESEEAMDPARGFVGSPSDQDIPGFCGRCHSDAAFMKRFNPTLRVDQQAEYATSVHGQRLAGGDTKVANCVSCHGNHGIAEVKDPKSPVYPLNVAATCGKCHSDAGRMASYGIPTDQAAHYAKSVHANALIKKQDLTAPTCNDCHGNHGATPPGVNSIAHVCGTCHARQEELFAQSPHRQPFEESSIAGCVACHENHEVRQPTDALIGTTQGAACVKCHSEGEEALALAGAMHNNLSKLSAEIDSANALLSLAANAGMEVSRPLFELKGAHDNLINARVVIHSLSRYDVDSLVKVGLTTATKSRKAGVEALDDLDFRRMGLIASLVIILLAAVSVYLKIRQIERRNELAAKDAGEAAPSA